MGASAGSSIFAGTANLAGAYSQYNAYSLEGKYAQAQGEANARLVERQAIDVIRRGEKEAFQYKKKLKLLQGSQKTSLAAQGIEISGDTALDILQETAEVSEIDAMTIRNNAWRESYGLKSQAIEYRAQGKFARAAAQAQAQSSLITGASKAYGNFSEAYGGKSNSSISRKELSRIEDYSSRQTTRRGR